MESKKKKIIGNKKSKSPGKNNNEKLEIFEDEKPISKSPGKNNNEKLEKFEDKKPISKSPEKYKFNLDFIYRREKYTLKNLLSNFLVSGIKKLISKKLSIELDQLKFYYMNKELKDDKLNVYELIKQNNIDYFEVKKEILSKENIVSLNTKVDLIYKVKCTNILSYQGLFEEIENFFREIMVESHFLCVPIALNTYEVGFACSDHCFLFKRYMIKVKRKNKNFENSTFDLLNVDKNKIMEPLPLKEDSEKDEEINGNNKKLYSIGEGGNVSTINVGPYLRYEEIKRKEEIEGKKKWITKKGFSL